MENRYKVNGNRTVMLFRNAGKFFRIWSRRQGLNLRPSDYKSVPFGTESIESTVLCGIWTRSYAFVGAY